MNNLFLSRLAESFSVRKDKNALLWSGGKAVTYGELDGLSGRIAAYLRAKGLGREDRVVILMPRGIEIIAAMVGCWRAGCSLIVCENNMAADRVRYIIADSSCRLTVTEEIYAEMLRTDYSPAIADPDQHDAAYLVYTSGTTGNPKGVLHEFGNIDEALRAKQFGGSPIPRESDTVAINAPLNFVAAVDYIVNLLGAGGTVLLMDMKDVKNSAALKETYERFGVTCTFMTPSLFRSVPALNPQMDWIILGGEPCVNLSSATVRLFNGYNMSEAGRDMLLYRIDRAYGLTPVGMNRGGEHVVLLDEDGKEVPDGETGEICFPNNYVRGYIGAAADQTEKKWRGGLFHTGDLGKRLEDGSIVLQGRSDDMIKINGNRIEPAEIEIVAKRELNLAWACAKGFVTPERSFVVLYYKDGATLRPDEAREKIGKFLTSYMIPSYFVKIDEIPLLPTGKLDKKKLLMPDVNAYKAAYVAPSTESEKAVAAAFEKVLGMEHIGVDDDFYELGGDSLSCIELIVQFERDVLDVSTVFRCRTVGRIAAEMDLRRQEREASGEKRFATPEEKEACARTQRFPLTVFQTNMFDFQLFEPLSTMWNLQNLFRFDRRTTDAGRFYRAVKTAAEGTAIFRTRIRFNELCELEQYIDPDATVSIERILLTDADFEQKMNSLNYPFRMLGAPYITCKVFETRSYCYLYILAHHLIIDGRGIDAFLTRVAEAYKGNEPPLDTYYSYLLDRENRRGSRAVRQAQEYFESTYGTKTWCRCPKPDTEIRDHTAGAVQVSVPLTMEKLAAIEKSTGLSRNGLSAAVLLLAMAADSGEDNVMISWVFHRRTDLSGRQAAGLLIGELPIGVTVSELPTLSDLYAAVGEKINAGMANSDYDWLQVHMTGFDDDTLMMIYEGDLFAWGPMAEIGGGSVALASSAAPVMIRRMAATVVETPDGLVLSLPYLKNIYTDEHIGRLRGLIAECANAVFSDTDPHTVPVSALLHEKEA